MQESHTPLSVGHLVVVRDERWTVIDVDRFDHAAVVSLRGAQPGNRGEAWAVISPADAIQRLVTPHRLRQRSRRAVLATAAAAIAATHSWEDCWTAAQARIEQRAWQCEPALAAVRGAMRILLADEVGLGKTIQAALIITELRARGLATRALVLTPASLREQWAGELRERFALEPAVFDQSRLATMAATLPPQVNPWITEPLIVSSIDLVKRPEVRAALESVPFDVLVVDEAHHLTPGSDRGAVAAELAHRTPWVVLATATPHGGDDDAFRFLQRLGDAGTEEIRMFSRSRQSVVRTAPRRSRLLFVRPTAAERALLDATRDYSRALTAGRADSARHLIASVISRRAASSAEAAHGTFLRRIALLGRHIEPERQTLLPWEDDDADAVSDAVLSGPGLTDLSLETAWLSRLACLAATARPCSSKVGVIRRLLRRTQEPLLVFSEYRDVAQLVAAALADQCTVTALHGALSSRQRREAVQAFNSGRVRVLVATDAAGEGLNLQARCRLVINMELPWVPRRLEQRIGRVDRLGQQRRVHALHLAHRDSYEGTVIARLERRRALISSQEHRTDVAHGGSSAGHTPDPLPAGGAADAREYTGGVYASRARSTRSSVLLLHLVTLLDGRGRLVQRSVVACRIEGMTRCRRLRRQVIRRIASSDALRRALESQVGILAASAGFTAAPGAQAMERRIAALVSQVARSGASELWQASLFDRRTEQRAHARRRSTAVLQRHLRQLADNVGALGHVTAGEVALVAAWAE
jgi:superfamily II DNA or RNA helicase